MALDCKSIESHHRWLWKYHKDLYDLREHCIRITFDEKDRAAAEEFVNILRKEVANRYGH